MNFTRKILFVNNEKSGNNLIDWRLLIDEYFIGKDTIYYSILTPNWECAINDIKQELAKEDYDTIVAIGGDGTVNTVAKAIYGSTINLGIIPNGSGNGLAKDLNLNSQYPQILDLILQNNTKAISSLTINQHFCIHLSDLGFNAKVIKRFELVGKRGIVNYLKAGLRSVTNYNATAIKITANGKIYEMDAIMVVIANAKMYSTGFTINPLGSLTDNQFEIIVIKPYSILEIGSLALNKWQPQQDKISIIQCSQALIESENPIHFQVDGEYFNKTKRVEASINNRKINTITPMES